MDPNLVGPACLWMDLKKGATVEILDPFPAGDCDPALPGPRGHPLSLLWMSSNRRIDQAFYLIRLAISDRDINLLHGPIFELFY
jgi:hypothetical protein